jgi:tRNA(Arg) A34 adenosine deaminase TadA
MNDHHLILGRLTDFLSGQVIDDTHDERYRQMIARLLVQKGYSKEQIVARHQVAIQAGPKCAQVPVTFMVTIDGRAAILIHYGPGSLVTRHRPALALARLAAPHQIPIVVITNGENADILDGHTGKVKGSGFEKIPAKGELERTLTDYTWPAIAPARARKEARIVMAFEVDDRCPCDSTVCRWDQPEQDHPMNHETHMRQALDLARQALAADEFPVGCIVVYEGQIIAQGRRANTLQPVASEIDHAEMLALRQLEQKAGALDRGRMTLYATLEPCLMCFSAILLSRIGTLVYAYEDAMGGAASCDRSGWPALYRDNRIHVLPGVCRPESLALFKDFFGRAHLDYWRGSFLAQYTLAQANG